MSKNYVNFNSKEPIAFDLDEKDLKKIDSKTSHENESVKLSDEELQNINGGFAIRNAALK